MSKEQIKYMVDRFLQWKLPENFNPDGGISFKKTFNENAPWGPMKHEPVGTNLFDAVQTEAMVRYMVDGLPAERAEPAAEPQPAYDAKCICGHQRIDHNPFKGGYCQRCKPSCAGFLAEPAAGGPSIQGFLCRFHAGKIYASFGAQSTEYFVLSGDVGSQAGEFGLFRRNDVLGTHEIPRATAKGLGELEQVKAERDQLNKNADTLERHMVEAETLIRGLMLRAKGWPEYTEAEQWLEAALGEERGVESHGRLR